MKINRFFLATLVVAGVFTACSNDEAVQESKDGNAISFRVQGGTPSLRTTATTVANVDAFVVYGTDNEAVAKSDPAIFSGVTVARKVGSATAFDYNPKKYYSENAELAQFAAFSPVSSNITYSAASPLFSYAGGFSFDYTVKKPGDAGVGKTAQEDLLVAGITQDATAGTVQFDFKHALARIFVKASSSLSEPVIIRELTLRNLYPSGKISSSTPTAVAGTVWAWSWIPSGTKTYYSYILAPSGVAVDPATVAPILVTSMEQGMMVIPQATVNADDDVEAGDFALEVKYDVANLTNQFAYMYLTDGYSFNMGTQYAITVTFNMTVTHLIEIDFSISVGNFDNDPTTMP